MFDAIIDSVKSGKMRKAVKMAEIFQRHRNRVCMTCKLERNDLKNSIGKKLAQVNAKIVKNLHKKRGKRKTQTMKQIAEVEGHFTFRRSEHREMWRRNFTSKLLLI